MKAVILAGGKGTRLQDLTKEIPKPMIKVGEKPVLQHQVELLVRYGFTDIIILVNYLKETIVEYFGDGNVYGANITYFEEKEPLGTVGGIKAIEDQLDEDFLVLYGDVMMNMNLHRFVAFHQQKKSDCTLVLHPNDHPYDSDLVDINDDARIIAFHSKPHDDKYYRNLVNAGAYILSTNVLKKLQQGVKADFGKDIFPFIYHDLKMFGYNTSEYLKDMGTPDRLEKVNADYASGKIERSNLEHKQKACFLDRDGVLIEEVDLLHDAKYLQLFPYTPASVKKVNQAGFVSVVTTNQSVIARNMCSLDELQRIHNKLETLLGKERAYLDAIYFCPHHPDKGFPGENERFKIECECRKPKSGMLLKAAETYNIDLTKSFMVGDADRDIMAAKNVGATAIGVMTGKGFRNARMSADYFFQNLKEAVDFIIDEPFKDIFEKCLQQISSSKKKPFIIAIGGNTRTGKSSLATYIKKQLEQKNIKSLHIVLDNWLIGKEKRQLAKNVFERFQTEKINQDFIRLLNNEKIDLVEYHHDPVRKTDSLSYVFNDEEVIIVEGIVALAINAITDKANLKISFSIPENELKNRVKNFYLWKGFSDDEAEQLFQQRQENEYKLVSQYDKNADIILPALGIS